MSGGEYIKEKLIIDKTEEEKKLELIISIIKTKRELESNNKNFEYAEEGLIDYYSYQIKADQAKLSYLIKIAKVKGIELDMIGDIELTFEREEEAG